MSNETMYFLYYMQSSPYGPSSGLHIKM